MGEKNKEIATNAASREKFVADFLRIKNCVPFADADAGLVETMDAMEQAADVIRAMGKHIDEMRITDAQLLGTAGRWLAAKYPHPNTAVSAARMLAEFAQHVLSGIASPGEGGEKE